MQTNEMQYNLLINLKNRFEFNEKTRLWSIKGAITNEEFIAFDNAIDCLHLTLQGEQNGSSGRH